MTATGNLVTEISFELVTKYVSGYYSSEHVCIMLDISDAVSRQSAIAALCLALMCVSEGVPWQ